LIDEKGDEGFGWTPAPRHAVIDLTYVDPQISQFLPHCYRNPTPNTIQLAIVVNVGGSS